MDPRRRNTSSGHITTKDIAPQSSSTRQQLRHALAPETEKRAGRSFSRVHHYFGRPISAGGDDDRSFYFGPPCSLQQTSPPGRDTRGYTAQAATHPSSPGERGGESSTERERESGQQRRCTVDFIKDRRGTRLDAPRIGAVSNRHRGRAPDRRLEGGALLV